MMDNINEEKKFKIVRTTCAVALLVSLGQLGYYKYKGIEYENNQGEVDAIYEQVMSNEEDDDLEYNKALLKLKEEVNEDVQGILSGDIFATTYPVVQGHDEKNEYYLHHLVDGTPNNHGAIQISYNDDATAIDNNKLTYIYGHNMRDDSMFGMINDKCLKQKYMDNHSTLSYSDASGEYILTFAYAKTTPSVELVSADDKWYESYFKEEQENAITTGEKINADDKIVCLMTCDGNEETRTAVYYKITKTKSYDASKIINKGKDKKSSL